MSKINNIIVKDVSIRTLNVNGIDYISITEIGIKWSLIKNDDSYLLFQEKGSNNTKFFNFEKQEISDF